MHENQSQTTCKTCQIPFEITPEDKRFYKLFKVPEPKNCPTCRIKRRMVERNTRHLYKRKCDATGKEIISRFHEDHTFPVYDTDYWWSDEWDATTQGQPINLKKPFFKQFAELKAKTPHVSTYIVGGTLQNSEYTNCTGYLKNCYMIFEADYNEECYYSNRIYHSLSCVDCLHIYKSELCYECRDCQNCYNLRFSNDCENCIDSYFLSNCKSCKNCIGCINLRHKRYYIFNKQYTQVEYEQKLKELDPETHENIAKLREKSEDFFKTQPHKNLQQEHNENCFGDYLYNSKDAYYCFDCKDLEDCRYCSRVSMTVKDSMDYTGWGSQVSLMYQCAACGDHSYNLKFCTTCTTDNSDLEYCDQCTGCSNCFGCVSLKRKSYCILNKQYSKEEYERLRALLVEHMRKTEEYGEYFPIEIAPFGYNETIAPEYYPLTKEQALKEGFKWAEKTPPKVPQTYEVPEHIENVPDSITKETLLCTDCDKNFRIIPQELKFYHRQNLPIPKKCTNCRHQDRIALKNPKTFHNTTCTKCGEETVTTYPPEKNLKIYCEKCYKREVN